MKEVDLADVLEARVVLVSRDDLALALSPGGVNVDLQRTERLRNGGMARRSAKKQLRNAAMRPFLCFL